MAKIRPFSAARQTATNWLLLWLPAMTGDTFAA